MGALYSKIYNWVYPKKDYDQFLLQYMEWIDDNSSLNEFISIYKENAQQQEISKK